LPSAFQSAHPSAHSTVLMAPCVTLQPHKPTFIGFAISCECAVTHLINTHLGEGR